MPSTTGFRRRFRGRSTLLYRSCPLDVSAVAVHAWVKTGTRSFGAELEPRYIIRAGSLDQ